MKIVQPHGSHPLSVSATHAHTHFIKYHEPLSFPSWLQLLTEHVNLNRQHFPLFPFFCLTPLPLFLSSFPPASSYSHFPPTLFFLHLSFPLFLPTLNLPDHLLSFFFFSPSASTPSPDHFIRTLPSFLLGLSFCSLPPFIFHSVTSHVHIKISSSSFF